MGAALGAQEGTGSLPEAEELGWERERASQGTLRRDGMRWTVWTGFVAGAFALPGVALLAIEPLTFPAALIAFAHAWAIPSLQARRGARAVKPLGERAGTPDRGPEAVALGLLADLVGRWDLDDLRERGLASHRGRLGSWLIGESGAFLVRSGIGGRRVFAFCVRVGQGDDLPAADRVAHLLLALREDEEGFATVANMNFSGAAWRVRRHADPSVSAALASVH